MQDSAKFLKDALSRRQFAARASRIAALAGTSLASSSLTLNTLALNTLAISTQATAHGQIQSQPQTEDLPVFRVGVSDVRVDVQVTEKGRVLDGLTAADFVVFDEAEQVKLTSFSRDREPLSILLLLDVSGSMFKYLEQISASSKTALAQLRPGDAIGVMTFSRETRLGVPFSKELDAVPPKLGKAIQDKDLGSGTLINPSLLKAAELFAQENPAGRRAIVIVTDNNAVHYQSPDEEVIKALHDQNVVLEAIVVGKGRRLPPNAQSRFANPDFTPANVFRLAEESGGDALSANEAGKAFPEAVERLRTRYTLLYAAPGGPAGTFRKIRVELASAARRRFPAAEIRARRGYNAR